MSGTKPMSNAPSLEVVSQWGAIHILVNNAGISGLSRMNDADDSKWYDIVDTNLHGMYLAHQSGAAPHARIRPAAE